MLTGQPNVSGATDVVASYVITCFVAVNDSRTFFTAAMAVRAIRTNLRAVIADPATCTNALSCQRVAGRIVEAATDVLAALSIPTGRTLRLAVYT